MAAPPPPETTSPLSSGTADASARPGLLHDRRFVAALLIAVVVALGFGLIIPVLPLFAESFGVGVFAVTVVVAAFAGVRLLSNTYAGGVADRFGTGRAIAAGAVIVGVSSLASALAPSYWALVAFRGAGGFGSALFFTSLLAHVVRVVPADQRGRAMGMLQGAFLFGIAFGPALGGLLAQPLGLRWPFVIYAGFCAAAGVVALVLLPRAPAAADATEVDEIETAEGELAATGPVGRGRTWAVTRLLLRDRAFVAALVMMAASRWAATGLRFSLLPLFAQDQVGTTVAVLGIGLTLASATHLVLVWPVGKLADTVGRRALAAPAYFGFAIVAVALGFVTTTPVFLGMLALYGVATAFTSITPPAIVADVVRSEDTGVGVGVLNTAGDLGSVFGPLVSGVLTEYFGYTVGFAGAGVLLAIGGAWGLAMRETLPGRSAAEPAQHRAA